MIKINLLGSDGGRDHTGILMLGGYALSVVAVVLLCFLIQSDLNSQIANLEDEKILQEKELKKLQDVTKDVKDLEKQKKELQNKLTVIGKLKLAKTGPVRVLDDLNSAVPERSWLTGVKENSGSLDISGLALDNQTVAAFMNDLGKSEFFDTVELKETKLTEKKKVKMNQFTLQTKVHYAGALEKLMEESAQGDKKDKKKS